MKARKGVISIERSFKNVLFHFDYKVEFIIFQFEKILHKTQTQKKPNKSTLVYKTIILFNLVFIHLTL